MVGKSPIGLPVKANKCCRVAPGPLQHGVRASACCKFLQPPPRLALPRVVHPPETMTRPVPDGWFRDLVNWHDNPDTLALRKLHAAMVAFKGQYRLAEAPTVMVLPELILVVVRFGGDKVAGESLYHAGNWAGGAATPPVEWSSTLPGQGVPNSHSLPPDSLSCAYTTAHGKRFLVITAAETKEYRRRMNVFITSSIACATDQHFPDLSSRSSEARRELGLLRVHLTLALVMVHILPHNSVLYEFLDALSPPANREQLPLDILPSRLDVEVTTDTRLGWSTSRGRFMVTTAGTKAFPPFPDERRAGWSPGVCVHALQQLKEALFASYTPDRLSVVVHRPYGQIVFNKSNYGTPIFDLRQLVQHIQDNYLAHRASREAATVRIMADSRSLASLGEGQIFQSFVRKTLTASTFASQTGDASVVVFFEGDNLLPGECPYYLPVVMATAWFAAAGGCQCVEALDHDCAPGTLHVPSDSQKLGQLMQGSAPGLIVSGERCSTFNAGAFVLLPLHPSRRKVQPALAEAMQMIELSISALTSGAGPPQEGNSTTNVTDWAHISNAAPLVHTPLARCYPQDTLEFMLTWTMMAVFASHCCFPPKAKLPTGEYIPPNIRGSSRNPFEWAKGPFEQHTFTLLLARATHGLVWSIPAGAGMRVEPATEGAQPLFVHMHGSRKKRIASLRHLNAYDNLAGWATGGTDRCSALLAGTQGTAQGRFHSSLHVTGNSYVDVLRPTCQPARDICVFAKFVAAPFTPPPPMRALIEAAGVQLLPGEPMTSQALAVDVVMTCHNAGAVANRGQPGQVYVHATGAGGWKYHHPGAEVTSVCLAFPGQGPQFT